ncbi:MAG: hypothetical protein M3373_05360 [Gemmatimonadota bacterium]|nr:hypothetical protein [Gemmatimonadota bacterium]
MSPLGAPSLAALIAGIALLAGAAQAQGAPGSCGPLPAPGVAAGVPLANGHPVARELAVAPFESRSWNEETARVVQALGERVAMRLRRVRPFDVATRPPQRRLPEPPRADAEESRYVLTGTGDRSRRGTRVTVRLADSGTPVWSASFDRTAEQLPGLEAEIAAAVASRVFQDLSPGETASLRARLTVNPAAYRHYLLGNSYLAGSDAAEVHRAIKEYDLARKRDTTFATVFARLALGYARWMDPESGQLGSVDSIVVAVGMRATEYALRIDPASSEAWVAQGALLEIANPRDFTAASQAYERALVLDPWDAETHRRYGRLRMLHGDVTVADVHLRMATTLDPHRPAALTQLAELRMRERRYAEACELLGGAIATDPGAPYPYALRALARLNLRELRHAWGDAEIAVRLGARLQGEAVALATDLAAHDNAAARARMQGLLANRIVASRGPLAVRDGRLLAIAFAAAGDRTSAARVLERVAPRGILLWSVLHDPQLASLRGDARVRALSSASAPLATTDPSRRDEP